MQFLPQRPPSNGNTTIILYKQSKIDQIWGLTLVNHSFYKNKAKPGIPTFALFPNLYMGKSKMNYTEAVKKFK